MSKLVSGSVFRKTPEGYYQAAPLCKFDWLWHGFGTRAAPLDDLKGVSTLKQVHSAVVLEVVGEPGLCGEGDALLARLPGSRVGVKTADCVPVLIVDPVRRAVAAVHAGWRGSAAGISAATVKQLAVRFGSRPRDLHAAIGPGIGACCYEVGPEVAIQFKDVFPERMDLDERTRIDLGETNRRQLSQAGVPEEQTHCSTECTFCNSREFHSFRRDRNAAGRMLSVIGVL